MKRKKGEESDYIGKFCIRIPIIKKNVRVGWFSMGLVERRRPKDGEVNSNA